MASKRKLDGKRKSLLVKGAKENNLKEIDLEIPHDSLTVVTGLSGSGKSSLAFDTVYAEGQRRYIETFSPYTRQFFDKVKKPDVEALENVRPAIAIQQRTRVTNSRSTVGSITNINDYLKILWSNLSLPVCPVCGIELKSWPAGELASHLLKWQALKPESTFLICARLNFNVTPVARKSKRVKKSKIKKTADLELDDAGVFSPSKTREELAALGFHRYFNYTTQTIEALEDADLKIWEKSNQLLLVFDRIKAGAKPPQLKRLQDSLEQAYALGRQQLPAGVASDGKCIVLEQKETEKNRRHFVSIFNTPDSENFKNGGLSQHEFAPYFFCPSNRFKVQQAKPSLFTFNSPLGACPECHGFGKMLDISEELCVPNPNLTLEEGALQCWSGKAAKAERRELLAFCQAQRIATNLPWRDLPREQQDLIFNHKSRDFWGVRHWFKWLERKIYKMHVRVFLSRYRSQVDCPTCRGLRLRPEALAFHIAGKTLPEIWNMPVGDLIPWLEGVRSAQSREKPLPRRITELFNALLSRLYFLNDLGLPYLTLERQARTLSGGETQRVNLATALGSELVSTQFVLDEPSVGLHARDIGRLVKSIRQLTERGNSVLVVEHDLDCINAADNVVELGPKAGEQGGQVVYCGSIERWPGIRLPANSNHHRPVDNGTPRLAIRNACVRNLKGFDLSIPLRRFVCLTGVSGSGKSTLASEVIKKGYERHLLKLKSPGGLNHIDGFEHVDQVLFIDQSPLAKSPRANIATYSGVWDEVRDLLEQTEDAQVRALGRSAFSFNVDGGRCPACKGAGYIREDMQFLSDVYIQCEICLGKRFQPSVLEVRYKGKNVSEILGLSLEGCLKFFHERQRICSVAEVLCQLGLGHLTLGHALSDLSGGEAQRLKLVPFVEQSAKGHSLLIFDEPTTGLHLRDVERLIELFHLLCDKGHSVLCIEHNLSLIAACDWIIDLGPEGGNAGGQVLLSGSPLDFFKSRDGASYTAAFLKEYFEKYAGREVRGNAPARVEQAPPGALKLEGAREHNLKNISLDLPLNKVVALTGVSGSGKSTIAKDIIYAESQRRYLDCLSPYARQFINELKKPDIDEIKNIKPAICVYQHTFQPSRLSTVGTMSEIYNFLRLLYAKTGIQYCPDHPESRIAPLSAREIAAEIKRFDGKTVRLLAPVVKMKKGNHRAVLQRAVSSQITQVRVDGVFLSPGAIDISGGLQKSKVHSIEFTVGRFNPARTETALIEEAVELGLSLGAGTLIVNTDQGDSYFSTERTCPVCKQGFFKPDPEDLSFHSKRGACEKCQGTGRTASGALCAECGGARINALGRNLRLDGKNIYEACCLPPRKLIEFLNALELDNRLQHVARPVLKELLSRIDTLLAIGLEHLDLSRDCYSLSSGELQRLRLATAMGSALSGVLYIFDEPSAGLHPLDNEKVLKRLSTLKEQGNSVIMIEHDPESILASDHVIDVGPGGGKNGGRVVFNGPIAKFKASTESPTAIAVREPLTEAVKRRAAHSFAQYLQIRNGAYNNISKLNLKLPLNALVVVAGVSGAGKSSLLRGIVGQSIMEGKSGADKWENGFGMLSSDIPIARLLEVDQKPIGLNSRSTPASYLKIWDEIRKLFASTAEARIRGWGPGFFSYNSGKGRCPVCGGLGQVRLEMSFLPDAEVLCDNCGGSRFNEDAESVRYLGLSPSAVLNLTFEEARVLFAHHRRVHRGLHLACELGLGYLTLGQSSTTLSGGESQRIKLVSELSTTRKGHTLYVLDEPTTGLHKNDVARLVKTLRELVAKGNTVYVIEHDPDVILSADQVVELGPGPGAEGGKVIFQGAPRELIDSATPWGEVLSSGSAEKRVENL